MCSSNLMPEEPTITELFSEALRVSNFLEGEALRRKFMRKKNYGVKAWNKFVTAIEKFKEND